MMETIKPSLVIVYGTFIDGIFGDIILINYRESFYCELPANYTSKFDDLENFLE